MTGWRGLVNTGIERRTVPARETLSCCLLHSHGRNRNRVTFFQAAILEVLSFVIAARYRSR